METRLTTPTETAIGSISIRSNSWTGFRHGVGARLAAVACPARSLITKIHGRYYDVGKFEHPGGGPAIECARDRDSTALFESYHALFRTRPLRTLAQYEISAEQAEGPDRFLAEKRFGEAHYDWDATLASPFRTEVVEHARRYFEAERRRRGLRSIAQAMKAPPLRWLEVAALGAIFFATLVFYVQGYWAALFLSPIAGWLFMVNFWHDALHFAMSPRWRVNAMLPYVFPWFMSPMLWMHQHVIGHHTFPNDHERDPDIRAAPKVMRHTPATEWRPAYRAQRLRGLLLTLYALVCLSRNSLRDHVTHAMGWFNDTVPLTFPTRTRRILHIVGRLAVAWSLYVWPFMAFPFWKALAFAIVPSLILSEIFALYSQINHVTEEGMAGAAVRSTNFYEAQALASCNFAPRSYAAFLASGGLNLQIEHHLLPGVNHAHLYRLSPELREICERHGVRYQSFPSFTAALRSHFSLMRRLAEESAGVLPVAPRPAHATDSSASDA
jgi:fatty acid desaturase